MAPPSSPRRDSRNPRGNTSDRPQRSFGERDRPEGSQRSFSKPFDAARPAWRDSPKPFSSQNSDRKRPEGGFRSDGPRSSGPRSDAPRTFTPRPAWGRDPKPVSSGGSDRRRPEGGFRSNGPRSDNPRSFSNSSSDRKGPEARFRSDAPRPAWGKEAKPFTRSPDRDRADNRRLRSDAPRPAWQDAPKIYGTTSPERNRPESSFRASAPQSDRRPAKQFGDKRPNGFKSNSFNSDRAKSESIRSERIKSGSFKSETHDPSDAPGPSWRNAPKQKDPCFAAEDWGDTAPSSAASPTRSEVPSWRNAIEISDQETASWPERKVPDGSDRLDEIKACGLNACKAIFKARPKDLVRAYVTEETLAEFGEMLKYCSVNKKAYHVVRSDELNKISGSTHHEGVCVIAKVGPVPTWETLSGNFAANKTKPALLLILEDVGNPHNVGAIVRTAAHFGVTAILAADHETFKPSPSLLRTAEGGYESVVVTAAPALTDLIADLKKFNFEIIATAADAKSTIFDEEALSPRVAMIIGNESKGVSAAAKKLADTTLSIPGTGKVDSLNVSAATAALCSEFWRGGGPQFESVYPHHSLFCLIFAITLNCFFNPFQIGKNSAKIFSFAHSQHFFAAS
ncbi:MAG: hypothetical protein NTV34_09385 [Proteobacteria bacterium]|nr:hypothetical protein [Pseudomonadota bacterium]